MACTACVVTIDERPVYGTVVVAAEALRLQVWSREWETLGICEGQTVAVKVPGAVETRYLVAAVVRVLDTGNSWVHFTCPVEMRRSVAKVVPRVRLLSRR